MFFKIISLSLFLIVAGFPALRLSHAQSTASPGQVAPGGGTTLGTGMTAHFNNPANLMIRPDLRRNQVTFGAGGLYYSPGIPLQNPARLYDRIHPYFIPEDPGDPALMTATEHDRISQKSDRHHQTQSYELIPIGYTWTGKNRAFSFAMRSRGIGSFERNRHGSVTALPGGDDEIDVATVRFLNENYQVYHEASFAFARGVTIVNDWHSGLNTLYIGLAPKVLFAGMYSQIRYRTEYRPDGTRWLETETMEVRAAGDISAYLRELLSHNGVPVDSNQLRPYSNAHTSGIGIGIDAGLTYIIPLGDDTSLSPHSNEPLRKSLRFSMALTDLGAIRYTRSPGEWQSRTIVRSRDEIGDNLFEHNGKPGEFLNQLLADSIGSDVLDNLDLSDSAAFTIQLPTEFHAGMALQYRWFAAAADLNYRFNSPEFQTDTWRLTLASEVRLFRILPIAASVQLHPGGYAAIGAAAGLDFGFVRASGAVRLFRDDEESPQWQVNSISGIGLQLRF